MQSRTRNRRVLAVFLSIAAIGVAAVALFVPPVDVNTVDSTLDEYSLVTSMDVQLKLSANGDLDSTEQIQVAFPIERRGIFRIFDTEDPQNPDIEHPVTDVAVQRDGAPEHWEWVDSAKGTQTARIGREDTPLPPGIYTYTIDHSTTDVVGEVADDPNRSIWWWDAIGSGWAMPMDRVRVTAELPAEPLSVECVRGVSSACNMAVDGRSVVITESNLAPREAVTIRARFDADEVPPATVPEDRDVLWAVLAGLLGAGVAFLGLRSTKEDPPGFPVLFEPPPERPAVGARVLHEKNSPDAFQATIFDLGERGVVSLDSTGADWSIQRLTDGDLEPWETSFLNALGLSAVGTVFVVSKSVASGERIASAQRSLNAGVSGAVSRYLHTTPVGGATFALTWIAMVALVVLTALNLFDVVEVPAALIGFLAGFSVVGAFVAADVGRITKRTEEGRELWSRSGGFARFLTTDSSESRFDAAARMEWFPRYLPWAVAFGVADEWARRWEAQGVELPSVPYIVGWGYGAHGYNRYRGFDQSFNSAIAGASAAYTASKSSSGGGGGGFSGGSGGGGGGGGSW